MNNSSIKKNYIFYLFNQVVSFAIPLIVTPYTSRIFMADGIGIYSYTTANVTYFTLFSMLGIAGYAQRSIAICRDDRTSTSRLFWELQIIHFITFVITGIIYMVLVFKSPVYSSYYIAHSFTLLACVFDISWLYQAHEKFQFIAVRNCVVKIIMTLLIFGLIHSKGDLALYIFINSFATFCSNMTLWIGIRKYVDKVHLSELHIVQHFKDIFIFFIPTIAASVYSILDKSVINWITHDESENGYYEQAYKILTIANVFVQSLATVSAPRMSNIFSNGNKAEFRTRLNRSLQYMLFLALPTAFGITAIACSFVPIFFGAGFDNVEIIIYIFMPLVVVLGFSVYLDGMYLVPAGKRAQSAGVICMGSLLNLVLNIILVRYMAAIGAAIATLVTECFIASIMLVLSRNMIDVKQIVKSLVVYGGVSLIMFVVVKGMQQAMGSGIYSLVFQIIAGVFIYGIVLILIKDRLIWDYLRKILNKCSIFQ